MVENHEDYDDESGSEREEEEEEEPNFSDPEGFLDDITDQELLEDIIRKKPKEEFGIDSYIVVDNVPQVGVERLEKLQGVIKKIFSKFGPVQNEHWPMEGEGDDRKTKGYIFIEYENEQHAAEAVKQTNGYKLDKNHTFVCNVFSDLEKYEKTPEEWEPPEPQPYKDHGNLKSFMLNSDCVDQFSIIYEGGDKTSVYTATQPEPTVLMQRSKWTETYLRWSPKGTYMATFHQRGIALWGGDTFQQIQKFSHLGVQLIDFSPCERYLVTFSPLQDNKEDPSAVIFWDIRTGAKKRGFHSESAATWPMFKWSGDGKYFARLGTDMLMVYETPGFGLLEKKSIKIQAVKDFSWSPTDNTLAYWVPENGDVPARVTLLDIPSRFEKKCKNIFNVADIKMNWHKNGDFLCVKVDRYAKVKKEKEGNKYSGITYSFEIFRMREKQIPVDNVEFKEPVSAFAWEPTGSKFAVIWGEAPRINVSFYNVKAEAKVELLKTMDRRQANHLFWSPAGKFLVLAGLRQMNGVLEFIDTSDMTVMSSQEHFMASDVEWDPTGRYVTTAVSFWALKVDNAFWIWTFQGRLLQKHPMDRFCQFLWRPRPQSLLSYEQKKDVKKNIKKYQAQFELKDRMSQSKASKEMIEKRRKLKSDFDSWRAGAREDYEANKAWRVAARNGLDTDSLSSNVQDFDEEIVEFLVDTKETIIEE